MQTTQPMGSAQRVKSRILLVAVAAAVVIADQVTKSLAENGLAKHPVHLLGPVDLRLVFNSGAAFSLGRGLGPALAILAVLAVVGIWIATRSTASVLFTIAGGMVAGGALGNLSDRLFRHNGGSVVDFVYTRFWPTFNVADSCVTVGVILIVVAVLRQGPASSDDGD